MKRKCIVWISVLIALLLSPLIGNDDRLLLANTPIIYGEESFKARIEERTGGTREPVGLVLSGGSARAFAHIGVLKYLEEQEIVPDFIIGNSMGSIIALLYSAGLSPDQILQACSSINITELFSLSLPVNSGVLGCEKFKEYIQAFIPEGTKMEDLDIPVMIVCEDLVTKRQIRIAEGDFTDVMTASFAIPVYFSSVKYKDHLLIDGGQANLAPLDIAYSYAPFNIISTTFYNNTELNLQNPITALNVSIDIGKTRQGMNDIQNHPDDSIWIRCNVEGFSYMQFSAMGAIAERGYESAKDTLSTPEVKAQLSEHETGSVTDSMMNHRDGFNAMIDKFNSQYAYYQEIGSDGFHQALTLGASSYAYPSDPFSLRDDTVIGIQYGFSLNDWSLNALLGFSWQAHNFGTAVPALNLSSELYMFKALKIQTDLCFYIDALSQSNPYSPVCSLSQYFLYTFPIFGNSRLELKGIYELVNNFNSEENDITVWNGLAHLFTASGIFKYSTDLTDLYIEGGANLSLWVSSIRPFAYGTIRTSSHLGTDFLTISGNLTGRFAFDGNGNVPFFVGDGFRTRNSRILHQGSPSREFSNPQNSIIIASAAVGVDPSPGKTITMGELILFEKLSIQAYCDLLWYQSSVLIPEFSPGIEVKSDISLIGLRTVTIRAYIGYDSPSRGVIGGFWFNSSN